MKNFVKIAIAAAVLVGSVQAQAATGNVQFGATVDNSCTIDNIVSGSLGDSAGLTVLSSANTGTGGAAGSASVTTTSAAFAVSTDAPTAWDASPAGTPTTTFTSSHSGWTAGFVGSAPVTVNMAATASTGSFPSGSYTATVVLRCE
ncbi:MAG: hypothetical protein ACRCU5_03585 [Rhizobiaceae bacterium]